MSNQDKSINALISSPREVRIGEHIFKIRQLKLKELFGYFEEKITNKKLKEAHDMARMLEGSDRSAFLVEVWRNLPTGSVLTEMVTDALTSLDGVVDLLYLSSRDYDLDITIDKIKDLIGTDEINQIAPMVKWILGTKDLNSEDTDGTDGVEKKTEVIQEKN